MTDFYVEIVDDNMVAYEEMSLDSKEDIIRSDKSTRFQLCSSRCWRKEHYGTFVDNTFTCNWFNLSSEERSNPLGRMFREVGQIVEDK